MADARAPTSRAQARTARLFVAGQLLLLVLLVVVPRGADWVVPVWLIAVCVVGMVAGVLVMVMGATTLGRGLTAVPLPNRHAVLRTGGLYRLVRHPIYSGLLLAATGFAIATAGPVRLVVLAALVVLITAKARWEEARLADRFPDYRDYATRTPRFVPLHFPGSSGKVG